MKLLIFLIRRVIYAILVLSAVVVMNFILLHASPGDIAQTILGEMGAGTEEMLAEIRSIYGLDKSLPEQIVVYCSKVVRGDLGYSHYFDAPVTDLILQRVSATILLVIPALLFAIFVGTFLGVISSLKPNSIFSHFVTVFALAGYSAPVFWTGLMLLILFASVFPIFPVSGMYDPLLRDHFWRHLLDILHHTVLPVLTLGILYMAQYSRLSRATMLDVLGSDYIRTARAKGLGERSVIYKHALKNAILPVVTMAGLQIGQLFAGAIIVETVFNWPGMGRLAFDSILRRDHPTLIGILFFATFIVIFCNVITDISYRFLDPRIRSEET
jgi:peptide/nickel transport system permease protein